MILLYIILTLLAYQGFSMEESNNLEQFLDIIQEQQRQMQSMMNMIIDLQSRVSQLESDATIENIDEIEKLILLKTEKSFRMPNLRREYLQDFDLESGIKYMIERKNVIAVGNVPEIMLPENSIVIDPDVYYEIKFYICSKIPNIPCIPIYDEFSSKRPEVSNIFNINDKTLRFVPKTFVKIKYESGAVDVFEIGGLSSLTQIYN